MGPDIIITFSNKNGVQSKSVYLTLLFVIKPGVIKQNRSGERIVKMIRQAQEVSDTNENKSATTMFNNKQNNDRTTKASTSSNSSTTSAPQTPEAIAKEKYK